jgi:hypothetical protein
MCVSKEIAWKLHHPQDLLSRMNQIKIEIQTAEATVEKLKGEAAILWTAFREWEGGFASTLGIADTKKRSRQPLRPGSRSLESNLRVALTHSLNRSKKDGLSKKDAIAAAKEKLQSLIDRKGLTEIPSEILAEMKVAADEVFAK